MGNAKKLRQSFKRDTRSKKLKKLLKNLKDGNAVHNRELRTWLGEAEYANYVYECEVQKQLRDEIKNKPSEIKDYEQRLRLALLAYNKGEGASGKGRKAAATRYYREAETLFERALERLEEIVIADPGLCVWFDRDLNFAADGEFNLDPVSVPRVVTSRSLDNRGGGLTRRLQSKRDLKIAAIERALLVADGNTEKDDAGLTAAQKEQFAALLRLRNDDEI